MKFCSKSISIFWSWTTGAQRESCGECALKKNGPERPFFFIYSTPSRRARSMTRSAVRESVTSTSIQPDFRA